MIPAVSEDGDGTRHVMRAVLAHRSNQHYRELAMPTTADNEKVRSTSRFDQCWRGMALDDHGGELHPVKGAPVSLDSVFEYLCASDAGS